ncbi:MAG: hypothetical protein ABIO72_03835 [Patescibacteria group bacterium]
MSHNRRFLCLESSAGIPIFGTYNRILRDRLKSAEMVLEEFTSQEAAVQTVLASPDSLWFIVTHYGKSEEEYPGAKLIGAVRRHTPLINAYIVLRSGSSDVNEKGAKALGADTFLGNPESFVIPLQREFEIYINFCRKVRRNSVPQAVS